MIPRPPRWLLALGWALAGLGWLADTRPPRLVAAGVFAALTAWYWRWLTQGDRP